MVKMCTSSFYIVWTWISLYLIICYCMFLVNHSNFLLFVYSLHLQNTCTGILCFLYSVSHTMIVLLGSPKFTECGLPGMTWDFTLSEPCRSGNSVNGCLQRFPTMTCLVLLWMDCIVEYCVFWTLWVEFCKLPYLKAARLSNNCVCYCCFVWFFMWHGTSAMSMVLHCMRWWKLDIFL